MEEGGGGGRVKRGRVCCTHPSLHLAREKASNNSYQRRGHVPVPLPAAALSPLSAPKATRPTSSLPAESRQNPKVPGGPSYDHSALVTKFQGESGLQKVISEDLRDPGW